MALTDEQYVKTFYPDARLQLAGEGGGGLLWFKVINVPCKTWFHHPAPAWASVADYIRKNELLHALAGADDRDLKIPFDDKTLRMLGRKLEVKSNRFAAMLYDECVRARKAEAELTAKLQEQAKLIECDPRDS